MNRKDQSFSQQLENEGFEPMPDTAIPFVDWPLKGTPPGAGLSGLFLLGFSDAISGGFSELKVIAWGLFAIGILVLPILLFLRREYLSLLLRLAEGKRLNIEEDDFVDPGAIAILRERLATGDPLEVVFVLGNLQKVDPDGLVEAMPVLLDHPAEVVRVRALQALVALSANHDLTALIGRLELAPGPDDEAETRIAKIRAVAPQWLM